MTRYTRLLHHVLHLAGTLLPLLVDVVRFLELIARWDNTPHFPDLPGFPDHIHDGATGEVTAGTDEHLHRVG
jgi:hypothetical protein